MATLDLPNSRIASGNDGSLRLFALIIGINEYLTHPVLDGCVHDAEAIRAYLLDTLHTPSSHIVFLANGHATRDAIMSHFETHLINNGEIQRDDAILVYFAGHGTRSPAPGTWPSPQQLVESIVPYDEGTRDDSGRYIHGIPDRAINAQLRMLAKSKGTNITVIFDCCHSAGLSREISPSPSPGYKVRGAVARESIPDYLDSDVWGLDSQYPPDQSRGLRNMDMSTHVILAACQVTELAREGITTDGSSCGAFTDGLLTQLHKHRGALDQVTYHDLVTSLRLSRHQHPECIGIKKHCALFRLSAAHTPPKRYRLELSFLGVRTVDIGSASGVKVGTLFAVYGDIPASDFHLGILVATSTQPNSSVLQRRPNDEYFPIPSQAIVTVIDWNDDARSLKIFIDPEHEDTLTSHPLHHDASLIPEFRYTRVDKPDHADVVVGKECDGRLHIKRLCQALGARANQVVRFDTQPDLRPFFGAIAQFKYCLEQEHSYGKDIAGDVSLELHRVTAYRPFVLDPEFPTDLFTNRKATLEDDPCARYGLTIKNDSRHKFFVYVFALNSTNYSIENWYMPNPPDHALPGKEMVELCHGKSDLEPFGLGVRPGEQAETIIIKMYISNRPVDLTWMVQQFPFHSTGTRGFTNTAFHSREYVIKISRPLHSLCTT